MNFRSGWQTWEAAPDTVLDLFHLQGAQPGRNVLVTGGIHGDEYEGPSAIAEVARRLNGAELAGSVTLIPVANPAAFAAATRTNPQDGLNLARCFPGDPAGTPTQQLAASLFRSLGEPADCLIDLHSGGVNYVFLPLAGFYGSADRSNPSYEAARRFGLRHLWALPPTEGVPSFEMWKRGAAVTGCEYLGAGQRSADGVTAYRDGVLRLLEHWDLLPPSFGGAAEQTVLTGDWILSSSFGLFESMLPLGKHAEAGALVARVLDLRGHTIEEYRAPRTGIVAALRSKALIRPGDWAILVLEPCDAR